jgi:hypothetical protein
MTSTSLVPSGDESAQAASALLASARLKTDTDKLLPIVANALHALRTIMPDMVAHDEMLRVSLLMQPIKEHHELGEQVLDLQEKR